jgi:ribonuclease HII
MRDIEKEGFDRGRYSVIAGVDEAGRGPLAGDVVAAAVILDPENPIKGLTDSKKLSEKKRLYFFDAIKEQALAYGIGRASPAEIDEINILWASLLAMKRAMQEISITTDLVVVDGNRLPDWHYHGLAIVKGDQRVAEISAASILAKVTRDADLYLMHEEYPDYGFAHHKGYPTKQHKEALIRFGATHYHRRSFKPVKECIEQ